VTAQWRLRDDRVVRAVTAIAAIFGCGPAANPVVTPKADPVVASAIAPPARIGRVLVPAQLGDAGAIDRIPYGVRVATHHKIWMTPSSEPDEGHYEARDGDLALIWPAIGDAATRVQIVSRDDDAIIAIWIERGDLATVAVHDIALGDTPATAGKRAASGRGASLRAGAPIRVTTRDGGTARVEVIDRMVSVAGWIPATSIGEIFTIDRSENDAVANSSIVAGAGIRATPSASVAAIAVTRQALPVVTRARTAGWREVVFETPFVRVAGYVAVGEATDDVVDVETTGHGSGYGGSHTYKIDVPVGACLYSGFDGEVVGVNVARRTRLGSGRVETGWWPVMVGTWWGVHHLAVRDLAGAPDPSTATFELCTEESPATPR
jgi:hypothetical protein